MTLISWYYTLVIVMVGTLGQGTETTLQDLV